MQDKYRHCSWKNRAHHRCIRRREKSNSDNTSAHRRSRFSFHTRPSLSGRFRCRSQEEERNSQGLNTVRYPLLEDLFVDAFVIVKVSMGPFYCPEWRHDFVRKEVDGLTTRFALWKKRQSTYRMVPNFLCVHSWHAVDKPESPMLFLIFYSFCPSLNVNWLLADNIHSF